MPLLSRKAVQVVSRAINPATVAQPHKTRILAQVPVPLQDKTRARRIRAKARAIPARAPRLATLEAVLQAQITTETQPGAVPPQPEIRGAAPAVTLAALLIAPETPITIRPAPRTAATQETPARIHPARPVEARGPARRLHRLTIRELRKTSGEWPLRRYPLTAHEKAPWTFDASKCVLPQEWHGFPINSKGRFSFARFSSSTTCVACGIRVHRV